MPLADQRNLLIVEERLYYEISPFTSSISKCTFSPSYFIARAHQLVVVHTVMKYCVESGKTDFDGMGCFSAEAYDKVRAGIGERMNKYKYIQGGYKVSSLV